MTHYLGAHYDSDNLIQSAQAINKAGGNLVQIFLTIPGNDKTKVRAESELEEFRKYLEKIKMKVVVHSSYIHNIARNWDDYSWWLKNLELEIKYCHDVAAFGLVLHFGKKLELSLEEAYNNMFSSLVYLHNKTKDYQDIKIFLETSSGQGSELCYNMDDLAYFYKKIATSHNKNFRKRVKICVDTCHIFAAGNNISSREGVKEFFRSFNEKIGIDNIGLVHLNDCKALLGEKKDRHENIGKGYIGIEGLASFYKYCRHYSIPVVLETPNYGYRMEIKMLRGDYSK